MASIPNVMMCSFHEAIPRATSPGGTTSPGSAAIKKAAEAMGCPPLLEATRIAVVSEITNQTIYTIVIALPSSFPKIPAIESWEK
jgi:hypothetical protein